ncbi:hypothetical protein [Swaminathania salitolerans]|uniref:Uncharacterized protein n=1 Tax=Swaminathania salitolerans TaxID=182838 RepID=A0A511BKT3_9PROT|nr:hypothetical protein [Swaminathania salitolerans]GBQ09768.1 hypothetical protein AA21291_0188 [Swaminathania salitolerans LMG 21291]GEL00855.1 hypothetical protein SSA02_00180 [Swaminathania salitolerans]
MGVLTENSRRTVSSRDLVRLLHEARIKMRPDVFAGQASGPLRPAPRCSDFEREENEALPAGHAVSWGALWSDEAAPPSYVDALYGRFDRIVQR